MPFYRYTYAYRSTENESAEPLVSVFAARDTKTAMKMREELADVCVMFAGPMKAEHFEEGKMVKAGVKEIFQPDRTIIRQEL